MIGASQQGSLYQDFTDRFFTGIANAVVKKIKNINEDEQYYSLKWLSTEYSPTMTWESLSTENEYVSADVVTMDSSLPLKRRPRLGGAGGLIPKLGISFKLTESTLKKISLMQAQGTRESLIIKDIFADTIRCIHGIYIAHDIAFLSALSEGTASIPDPRDEGRAIRISYGYLPENQFTAGKAWNEAGYKALADVERMLSKAKSDGRNIQYLLMSTNTYNKFRNSEDTRAMASVYKGIYEHTLTKISNKDFDEMLSGEKNVKIVIIDRVYTVQNAAGETRKVRPFKDDVIVGVESLNLGKLFYSTLAEEEHKVAGVTYTKPNDYILISKFSTTKPLIEYTTGESASYPILQNVEGFYHLDVATGAELSADPSEVEFPKSKATRTVTVTAGSGIYATIPSEVDWLSATVEGKKVVLNANANSGVERTAEVTIKDDFDNSITIAVTQAASA